MNAAARTAVAAVVVMAEGTRGTLNDNDDEEEEPQPPPPPPSAGWLPRVMARVSDFVV